MATKLNIDAIIDKSIPSSKLEDAIFQGTYNDMTVGNADFARDLTGRNEATPQSFTFQPSAGDMSIKDDSAYIKKIKGNSVVWNQLVDYNTLDSGLVNGVNITKNADGSITLNGTSNSEMYYNLTHKTFNIGDKLCLLGMEHSPMFYLYLNGGVGATLSANGVLTCNRLGASDSMFIFYASGTVFNNVTINPKVYSLTKMFGAGNEPTTVEEFYARIPSGIDINAYNEGEIIDLNTEAIKTVGFNQWDEQWERGVYKYWNNGIPSIAGESYDNFLRSKNLIKVLPNKIYSVSNARYKDFNVLGYDKDGIYQDRVIASSANVIQFTTPENCHYVKFYAQTSEAVAVYANDICINISHTGYKNGEYHPYNEYTRELPVIKKYFPNGMKKAGNAFDSIEWDSTKQKWVAVQRVGVVDLGDLSWVKYSKRFATTIPKAYIPKQNETPNLTTPAQIKPFSQNNVTDTVDSYEGFINKNNGEFSWYYPVSEYADGNSFKTAMLGVILYYELADPIVTEIEDVVDFDYYVEDFGTEESISSVASAAFNADIVYQFNAVDRIRQNDFKIEAIDNKIDKIIHGGTW